MRGNDPTDWYERHAESVVEQYEKLDSVEVHNPLLYPLPARISSITFSFSAKKFQAAEDQVIN